MKKINLISALVIIFLLGGCSNNQIKDNTESSESEKMTVDQKFIGEWIVVTSRGKLEAVTGQKNMSKGKIFNVTKNDEAYLLVQKDFSIVRQEFIKQDENT